MAKYFDDLGWPDWEEMKRDFGRMVAKVVRCYQLLEDIEREAEWVQSEAEDMGWDGVKFMEREVFEDGAWMDFALFMKYEYPELDEMVGEAERIMEELVRKLKFWEFEEPGE